MVACRVRIDQAQCYIHAIAQRNCSCWIDRCSCTHSKTVAEDTTISVALDLIGWCVLSDKATMYRVSFEQREVEPTVTISIFAVPVKAVANITQQRTAFRIVIIDVTAVLGQCFNDCFVTSTEAVSITTIASELDTVRSQELTARINRTLCRSRSRRRHSYTSTAWAAATPSGLPA